jgi:hypothetical protein
MLSGVEFNPARLRQMQVLLAVTLVAVLQGSMASAFPVCQGPTGPEGVCAQNQYITSIVVGSTAYCCTDVSSVRSTNINDPSTFSCPYAQQDCSQSAVCSTSTIGACMRTDV